MLIFSYEDYIWPTSRQIELGCLNLLLDSHYFTKFLYELTLEAFFVCHNPCFSNWTYKELCWQKIKKNLYSYFLYLCWKIYHLWMYALSVTYSAGSSFINSTFQWVRRERERALHTIYLPYSNFTRDVLTLICKQLKAKDIPENKDLPIRVPKRQQMSGILICVKKCPASAFK